MNILVSGGAGYIGSHTILALLEDNHNIVVIDDMSTGSEVTKKYLESIGVKFYIGNINNEILVTQIIKDHNITDVLNFAGYIVVSESVENPIKYYENNYVNTLSFIKTCIANNVSNFIFSSTASVYSNANKEPVKETSKIEPMNPYAQSKLMVELSLKDIKASNPSFNYGILRYFNVAGADYKSRLGQVAKNDTHLIKIATKKALNKTNNLEIYGTDYNTDDGTCIRDYIHISDLAQAHIDLLKYMQKNKVSDTFNCGYGKGYSVKEVISKLEEIIGYSLNAKYSARRAGDPESIIANNSKIINILNWNPQHDNLEEILKSSLEWEKKL